jgi:putative FmdB family regulatory protein
MPRYRYFCQDCQKDFLIFHGMNDQQTHCITCESNDIQKMLTKPTFIENKKDPKVGQLTKSYIEQNKEVLENLKEEAKKDYDGA